MNHQLAEELLFAEEALTDEQKKGLAAHLDGCASCRQMAQAWQATEKLLKSAPSAEPAPNFTLRWQARLAEERARRLRSLNWILLIAFSLSALVLFGIWGFQQFTLLHNNPTIILTNSVLEITAFVTYFRGMGHFIGEIFDFLPFAIPLILWINLAVSSVILCLVWAFSIWRLPYIKRSTQ